MKKLLIGVFFALAGYGSVTACAICGCGSGNYYLGMMPQFSKNFIGMRYRYYSFTSHVGQGYRPFEATHETFRTVELWMRFYVSPRIQIISLVDYNINTQLDQGVTKNIQGIGDIPVLLNYNVINTFNHALGDTRKLNHSLFVGGGVKLPTGKYKFSEDPAVVANANFQLGTGSVDYLFNTLYILRRGRAGLSVDANYKINSRNSDDYKFGNRFTTTAALFYVKQFGKIGVMPNAGVYFENSGLNEQYNIKIDITGGTATFASLGVEAYFKRISTGINFQTPMSQHLADGHSIAHDKTTVHLTYLFGQL